METSGLDGEENGIRLTPADALIAHTVQGNRRQALSSWTETLDEGRFSEELMKSPQKTSSVLHTSTFTDEEELLIKTLTDPGRLLGEIAFQLDRRILSYVFQEQPRLYGFTLQNIPEKIKQVAVHPLTGAPDEAYRLLLLNRHSELMDGLISLGYDPSRHPAFSELIVNTYGILKEIPDALQPLCGDPELLRRLLVRTAPFRILTDLLLLLRCLSFMSRRDARQLFLW